MVREVPMIVIPIADIAFDDAAIRAMGKAFDQACKSLRNFGSAGTVREIIAKRIIDAAKNGERDPARLHEEALKAFGIDDTSMLFVCVGPPAPRLQPTLWSRKQRDPRGPG
jgi:hypothetical protein